jgi:hypothetical protein
MTNGENSVQEFNLSKSYNYYLYSAIFFATSYIAG